MFRCTRFARLLVVLAVTASGFAQRGASHNGPPASALPPDTPPAAAPVSTTIKARAQLVIVDVVVTDSNQKPVHGLKASDFSLTDNNAEQKLTVFEEHTALPPAEVARAAAMPPLPPGLFTNFTPVPDGAPVNILLMDSLNTQMKDQMSVRNQLLEFLKNAPAGTRIAIFSLNTHLVLLQGLTSDLSQLRASVERSSPSSSSLLPDAVGAGGTQSIAATMAGVGGRDIAQLMGNIQHQQNAQNAMDQKTRIKVTLDAMDQLARYLGGLPGRKNLIWFSSSFPLNVLPSNPAGFEFANNSEGEYRETANLLARAQVAVYPVDARGLQANITSSANSTAPSGRGAVRAQASFLQTNVSEHDTMNSMAADTGGHAYTDANGLAAAATQAIDNGSNYYTLAFVPSDARQDGEFHKLQVKLAQQGLTLAYRSGYYTDPPDVGPALASDSTAAAPGRPSDLTRTMMLGSPTPTEIMLKLLAQPVSDKTEPSVAKNNFVNPMAVAQLNIKGPWRRYAIDIAADAHNIRITPTPDGHYQFSAEVVTYVYEPNGVLINRSALKARGNLSASSYANMRLTGIPFHQEISVPAKGDFYLRTSVHDLNADRFGAVEVPVASIEKLAPLDATAANAPASAPH